MSSLDKSQREELHRWLLAEPAGTETMAIMLGDGERAVRHHLVKRALTADRYSLIVFRDEAEAFQQNAWSFQLSTDTGLVDTSDWHRVNEDFKNIMRSVIGWKQ